VSNQRRFTELNTYKRGTKPMKAKGKKV